MSKSHENKVALVTGASKGIGKTGRYNSCCRSRSDETAKAVEAEGRKCLVIQCDVSNQEAVNTAV